MFGCWRKEEKLYKQWAEHANLPPAAIPGKETYTNKGLHRETIFRKEAHTGKNGRPLNILYILLGVALLVLCTGVILIFVKTC